MFELIIKHWDSFYFSGTGVAHVKVNSDAQATTSSSLMSGRLASKFTDDLRPCKMSMLGWNFELPYSGWILCCSYIHDRHVTQSVS